MTSIRQEGQTFGQQYRLDQSLRLTGGEAWVATRKDTGDRVFLSILGEGFPDDDWQTLTRHIDRLKGLLHQNITLMSDYGEDQGRYWLAEPYIAGGRYYDPDADNNWPLLSQLLDALIYAHHLGIPHGHLQPSNLIIDQSGGLHVTGFCSGIDPSGNTDEQAYLSPQILEGAQPDMTDDVYSLGCILFQSLTGKPWTPGVELDAQLPAAIHDMVEQMLSQTVVDRQISLSRVRETLKAEYEEQSPGIASVDFSRPTGEPDVPDQAPAVTQVRPGSSLPIQTVLLVTAGLIISGLLLFLLLQTEPRVSKTAPATAGSNASPTTVHPTTVHPNRATGGAATLTPREKAAREFLEQEGQRVAREILRLQVALEDLGVMLWAAESYQGLTADLDNADQLYRDGSPEQALEGYQSVLAGLQQIIADANNALAEQIAIGSEALERGDPDTALTALTIATAIDGEDQDLRQRLTRAENLEQVLYLVQQAEATERNGDLDDAAALFRQARDLDGLWQPAREGYRRVSGAITRRQFRAAMSEGFRAIANKDYPAARAGFAKAQSILPDSNEPADGLLQIEQTKRNDLITQHREQAEAFAKASDWPAAIREYQAALAITPTLEFALQGLAKAEGRQEINEQISRFLSDPTLLQSNENLDRASGALRDASRVSPQTDRLQQDMDTLAQLVSTARIKIPVTISSDGKTSVTVRKHKELGAITSEVVYLIPGRYAIIGTRPGYRDARHDLVLVAGRPVPEVRVASTERVR